MIKEKIKKHLIKYCEDNNIENYSKSFIEVLKEAEHVHVEFIDTSDMWDNIFYVVSVDGMLIGYNGTKTKGDKASENYGWVFDPDTICEATEHVEVKKSYKRKVEK